ncbi:CPBP family intramembrane metalloprotease (plasmid) [Halorussus limi]|uniref:CPBP family intramembrane metalloprotease n=1 Tax=Halorussus limi TaxID=2938695 RepID=A0A8U0I0C5_9EURY|nr:CPBP family intramembrane glutamic endopeptidase [Halorussus limi]UPV76628.1 CPBP family intramembrane metalloprotease [Halorussus limi]
MFYFVLPRYLFRAQWLFADITGIDLFGTRSTQTPAVRALDRDSPEPYTTADLVKMEDRETTTAHEHAQRMLESCVVAPTVEEAVFRGLPLLIATMLTGHVVAVLLVANAVWAYLHVVYGRATHMVPHFLGGLLSVYLWLHGLGILAVIVHAMHNLAVLVFLLGTDMKQRRNQKVFSPGEEYEVTVSRGLPDDRKLSEAETADGRTLRVADVIPDEECRVRVAAKLGWTGYAYPLARSDEDKWQERTD